MAWTCPGWHGSARVCVGTSVAVAGWAIPRPRILASRATSHGVSRFKVVDKTLQAAGFDDEILEKRRHRMREKVGDEEF